MKALQVLPCVDNPSEGNSYSQEILLSEPEKMLMSLCSWNGQKMGESAVSMKAVLASIM